MCTAGNKIQTETTISRQRKKSVQSRLPMLRSERNARNAALLPSRQFGERQVVRHNDAPHGLGEIARGRIEHGGHVGGGDVRDKVGLDLGNALRAVRLGPERLVTIDAARLHAIVRAALDVIVRRRRVQTPRAKHSAAAMPAIVVAARNVEASLPVKDDGAAAAWIWAYNGQQLGDLQSVLAEAFFRGVRCHLLSNLVQALLKALLGLKQRRRDSIVDSGLGQGAEHGLCDMCRDQLLAKQGTIARRAKRAHNIGLIANKHWLVVDLRFHAD